MSTQTHKTALKSLIIFQCVHYLNYRWFQSMSCKEKWFFFFNFRLYFISHLNKKIEKIHDKVLAWVFLSAITDRFITNIQIMTSVRYWILKKNYISLKQFKSFSRFHKGQLVLFSPSFLLIAEKPYNTHSRDAQLSSQHEHGRINEQDAWLEVMATGLVRYMNIQEAWQ